MTRYEALLKFAMAGASVMPVPSPGATPSPPESPPTTQPSATGATAMAGMSTHCDKCFAKLKGKNLKKCPSCGNPIKSIRDIESSPSETRKSPDNDNPGLEVGETGGEAMVNEELREGDTASDSGKYAAFHPLVSKLKGGVALAVAPAIVVKKRQMKKQGAARYPQIKNPLLNLSRRGGSPTSASAGMERIKCATHEHTQKILSRMVP